MQCSQAHISGFTAVQIKPVQMGIWPLGQSVVGWKTESNQMKGEVMVKEGGERKH